MGAAMTEADQAYDDLTAFQTCLAAEHGAVYGYGVVGGRLAGLRSPREIVDSAAESYEWHRSRRDALDQSVRDLGADPVTAEPAYSLPLTPDTVPECQRLARYLESHCSQAYAYAISIASPQARGRLAASLSETAVRAASWGARLEAFPGRPDL
jgi:hypothetical protein